MNTLASVISRIPGLAGYEASRQQNQQQEHAQMAQAQGLMSIIGAAQKQQEMQRAAAQEQMFRREVAALGPDATEEQFAAVASKYAPAKDVLHYRQQAATAKAAQEAARAQRQEMMEYRYDNLFRMEQADRERASNAALATAERAAAERRADETRRFLGALTDAARREGIALRRDQEANRAPSLTEIVDPMDPAKMLRVDARTFNADKYRAGDRTGVIGTSGKEPAAAKRDEEKEKGRRQITDVVDGLAADYDNLEKMGAVISSNQPGVRNVWERAAASGPGQLVAGALGTRAQAVRDQINNKKPLLMAAIKQASGMSSQQMNSNMELQFYLQAATDPTKSIESNRAALAILDRTYGLGTGVTANQAAIEALTKLAPKGAAAAAEKVPAGIDPKVWAVMTPEEKALWK